jgi:hypothetical protein
MRGGILPDLSPSIRKAPGVLFALVLPDCALGDIRSAPLLGVWKASYERQQPKADSLLPGMRPEGEAGSPESGAIQQGDADVRLVWRACQSSRE